MRTRNRGRGWSRGAGGGEPPPDAAHTILTITDDTGVAVVTTAAAHGLAELDEIVISGCSDPTYDGAVTVGTVPAADQFFHSAPFSGESTGGTWAPA